MEVCAPTHDGVLRAAASKLLLGHPLSIPGIPDLVALLRSKGQEVFLVSGGFRQASNVAQHHKACTAPPALAADAVYMEGIGASFPAVPLYAQIIHPLAESLGIPLSHVFANSILFDVSRRAAGWTA